MKERLIVISIFTFFLFSLLVAQFFKIQILEGEKWTKQALSQHEFIISEPFRRGAFFSNTSLKKGHPEKEQPFVFDVTKYHLYLDPIVIPSHFHKEIALRLVESTSLDKNKVLNEIEKKSRSRRVAMWLDRDEKEQILSWWNSYAKERKIPRNALYFVTDYRRCYPYGKLLGQVLHTIRDMKDETTNEGLPTGGLESYFNTYLKGKQGKRKLLRSPLNHLEIDKLIEAPEDGADIYLTVNHCIQAIVEEELEKGVLAANAKGGWAVMMDPVTGEILALAQYPYFEPEHYRDFFNDPERIENSKVKSITDVFEIGSIMKPITVATCLKANKELRFQGKQPLFDPDDKIDTKRTIFPGRGSKPLKDITTHTALNMDMAIQKSSNIYMAQLADRLIGTLGPEWYRKTLVETFGFSCKTGIELPAEASGVVPTPGKMHANGTLEWSLPTPYSLSIGYNLLATSLQMLRAYATFANGGYLVEPTLIRKIVKKEANGQEAILADYTSPVRALSFPKVLDEEIGRKVMHSLKFTTKMGGTGRFAEISGYTEAGKTGTAEKIIGGVYSKKRHISSFIGFAPANLNKVPFSKFVLIVTVDEAAPILLEGGIKNYMGGRCAAPIFSEIAKRTLEYLGVPPDDPCGYPTGDPRFVPEKADWVKEVQNLKTLYEQWNHL